MKAWIILRGETTSVISTDSEYDAWDLATLFLCTSKELLEHMGWQCVEATVQLKPALSLVKG